MHLLADGKSYECEDCFCNRRTTTWYYRRFLDEKPANKPQFQGMKGRELMQNGEWTDWKEYNT
jgi:hypothetical protein